MDATDSPPLLIGCGILRNEIQFLISRRGWDLENRFLSSSLHVDYERLEHSLRGSLRRYEERRKIFFYGACHPSMTSIMGESDSIRTRGQNCMEILLGRETFLRYLEGGAFFLVEDWARHWDKVIIETFGNFPMMAGEILREEHRFILALETPCSGDYRSLARRIGKSVELPVIWLRTDLDNLEAVLLEAMKGRETKDHA